MRVIIYRRVSTQEQADSGAGLAAQGDACQAWCQRQGAELAGIFSDEGVSGAAGLDARPALLEAIALLGKGDALLVAKRDRIARDPLVAAMVEAAVQRRGARVVSAAGEGTDGDGPADVLMRRIIDAFAEYERLVIKARTKAALKAKKARQERVGSIPYGAALADDEVHLVEEAHEREAIAAAQELRAAGLSLRQVALELERRCLISRKGKRFEAEQIRRMLAA